MALFKKVICAHCEKEIGVLDRVKLADDNYICYDCSKKCSRVFAEKKRFGK